MTLVDDEKKEKKITQSTVMINKKFKAVSDTVFVNMP